MWQIEENHKYLLWVINLAMFAPSQDGITNHEKVYSFPPNEQ